MNELIMTIDVKLIDFFHVKGHTKEIVMIPFTAKAYGNYFTGETIGTGVDTQKILPGEKAKLSARYMLEGTDFTGKSCKVFIENETYGEGLRPMIVTDSEALQFLEERILMATLQEIPDGVQIQVFCKEEK